MPVLTDIVQIRQIWINKVTHRLARGEGLRESFREQLEVFYDALIQSVETGDPAWMEPVVDEWVQARTVSELEARENSIFPVLDQFLAITSEVAEENMGNEAGFDLIRAILPIYTYMFDIAAQREMNIRIEHTALELDKARDVLERLDKSKSDFIAIAAHELKTPLTLIEGYASMVAEQLNQSPEQAIIMLKGIDTGTQRLREIIDDMIDVSLIDNNMLSLNFQPVWINRLLHVIEGDVRDNVVERKLRLEIMNFPGSDEMFFADSERLYQAFRNLILNAIKFTPDGGSITIEGRSLPGFVEVTVTDTGIGIPPEDHSRIFEKFGRLGSATLHSSGKTKFKGGGPGLGLPITKGIVEAHGGAIWVESEGHDEVTYPGATFHVLLPVREEPPDEKIARLFKSHTDSNMDRDILVDNL